MEPEQSQRFSAFQPFHNKRKTADDSSLVIKIPRLTRYVVETKTYHFSPTYVPFIGSTPEGAVEDADAVEDDAEDGESSDECPSHLFLKTKHGKFVMEAAILNDKSSNHRYVIRIRKRLQDMHHHVMEMREQHEHERQIDQAKISSLLGELNKYRAVSQNVKKLQLLQDKLLSKTSSPYVSKLEKEHDELKKKYSNLMTDALLLEKQKKEEKDQFIRELAKLSSTELKKANTELKRSHTQLIKEHDILTQKYDQLRQEYGYLALERDQLQLRYDNLVSDTVYLERQSKGELARHGCKIEKLERKIQLYKELVLRKNTTIYQSQPNFYSWMIKPTADLEFQAIDKAIDDNAVNDRNEVVDLADKFIKKINKPDQSDKDDQPETC